MGNWGSARSEWAAQVTWAVNCRQLLSSQPHSLGTRVESYSISNHIFKRALNILERLNSFLIIFQCTGVHVWKEACFWFPLENCTLLCVEPSTEWNINRPHNGPSVSLGKLQQNSRNSSPRPTVVFLEPTVNSILGSTSPSLLSNSSENKEGITKGELPSN